MNDKLEIAKKVIKENYAYADGGIFDCENHFGDPMYRIYDQDGLQIDICYRYEYFEVFGLTNNEFAELESYYEQLGNEVTENDRTTDIT